MTAAGGKGDLLEASFKSLKKPQQQIDLDFEDIEVLERNAMQNRAKVE